METPEFLTYAEVLESTGIARRTLADRLAEGVVPTYMSGTDRRRRLIHREDLPKLIAPRPVNRAARDLRTAEEALRDLA